MVTIGRLDTLEKIGATGQLTLVSFRFWPVSVLQQPAATDS